MPSYCDAVDVATYLGRDLSDAEAAQVQVAIDAASATVDSYTGRTWSGTAIVAELHTVFGSYVYLNRTPVTAISAVTSRTSDIGAVPATLAAGSDYELLDAARGLVRTTASDRSILAVSYTVTATVPDPVKLATTMLAARSLAQGPTDDGSFGIKRTTIGDFTVEYQAPPTGNAPALPPEIALLLSGYRQSVIFA
jgi:hypothetical protein